MTNLSPLWVKASPPPHHRIFKAEDLTEIGTSCSLHIAPFKPILRIRTDFTRIRIRPSRRKKPDTDPISLKKMQIRIRPEKKKIRPDFEKRIRIRPFLEWPVLSCCCGTSRFTDGSGFSLISCLFFKIFLFFFTYYDFF